MGNGQNTCGLRSRSSTLSGTLIPGLLRPESTARSGPGVGLGAVGSAASSPSKGLVRLRHITDSPHSVSQITILPEHHSFCCSPVWVSALHVYMRGCRGADNAHSSGSFRLAASCLGFSGRLWGLGSPCGRKARLWLSEGAGCTSHTWEVRPWATWGERGRVAPGNP